MKMTNAKIKEINNRVVYDKENTNSLVSLSDSLGGAGIKKGIMVFAEIEELTKLINDLTILREAILEETGIQF